MFDIALTHLPFTNRLRCFSTIKQPIFPATKRRTLPAHFPLLRTISVPNVDPKRLTRLLYSRAMIAHSGDMVINSVISSSS
ncbi:hypothetical protein KCP70_02530 [Salmonella enterica subsp. enterica]|nr:hypothetical protein KCP70_02530 [Salmonella enterica subsp. enterica]